MGRVWWPSSFDATLGFPSEAPPFPWVAPPPIGAWLRRAARVLTGDEAPANQPWIADGLSDEAIHDVLVGIALRGNSARPIAARWQSHPVRGASLLGTDDPTSIQAAQGCEYTFHQCPYQYRRPRPIRLAGDQMVAAAAEIDRDTPMRGRGDGPRSRSRQGPPARRRCVGASPPAGRLVAGRKARSRFVVGRGGS
jgi:hypothetical protein